VAYVFSVTSYLVLKYLHILSGAVLFGTGAGIAFFMFTTHRSRNLDAMRVVSRHVILADWIFTATAVVVQPITGVWMMLERGWSLTSTWFIATAALYAAVGVCWIPVVLLQYRMAQLLQAAPNHDALGNDYYRAFRLWVALGVPAFMMMLALYALMIFKPWL
jgi:uncharacterized membrane protein